MSSRLEQFIRDHRDEFDTDEPGKKVWEQIGEQTMPGRKEAEPLVWISARRWSVAAAVSLLIAGSIWYFTHGSAQRQGATTTGATGTATTGAQQAPDSLAANTTKPISPGAGTIKKDQPAVAGAETGPGTKEPGVGTKETGVGTEEGAERGAEMGTGDDAGSEASAEADFRKEMGYYAKLVELKHKELRSIEKDEPLLYKQFAWDVKKLDSVYRVLENQLPQTPNREQLLEAMSQNLQLQMGLLNHQLSIIKQINHSKKTAYEKAYKTT